MGATSNVGEGLVDRDPLDERREIVEHLDGCIAQPLIFRKMATDKDQLRTELARPPPRHACVDSVGLGFVRRGEHHAATDSDRLAAERRVKQLLD
jgi:hypothetical protein